MNINRRHFLGGTLAAGTSLLMHSLDAYAAPPTFSITSPADFSLKIMAPFWGFQGSITEFCRKAKEDGYDGIEILWAPEIAGELTTALIENALEAGFLCRGDEADVKTHQATFQKALNEATGGRHQRPLYINVHSGKDFFSYDDNRRFIDLTVAHSERSGVPIYHETHRSRMLYSAPASVRYLKENPGLRLTLDISHWCNVSESLLEEQAETVKLAIRRTDHVHSRVGHQQGPQVGDPRAPEWKPAVDAHFAWWDEVVRIKKEQGQPLTMLTEFGPPTYMPTIPFSNKPVADQWAVNVHMMNIWRKRYI